MNYPTTEISRDDLERKFERIVNLFVTVEIQFGYALPSDFCDEFLVAVKDAQDFAKWRIREESEI